MHMNHLTNTMTIELVSLVTAAARPDVLVQPMRRCSGQHSICVQACIKLSIPSRFPNAPQRISFPHSQESQQRYALCLFADTELRKLSKAAFLLRKPHWEIIPYFAK